MNIFLDIFREVKKLSLSLLVTGLLIVSLASFWGLYVATQVCIGVLISTGSFAFYTLIAWIIIVKKNIAWMGPVIVIKYSILIASVYYVWVHQNVFLVLMGIITQLIFSALLVALIKSRESRRIDDSKGS